jgi:1-acyl-sn-glycerol-3-phosphate acyltransferase
MVAGLAATDRRLLESPGNLLLLFPEGTRSTTGELGEFKPGIGVMLAGTIPVVPRYIGGAFLALPKGSRFPRPRCIELRASLHPADDKRFGPPARSPSS